LLLKKRFKAKKSKKAPLTVKESYFLFAGGGKNPWTGKNYFLTNLIEKKRTARLGRRERLSPRRVRTRGGESSLSVSEKGKGSKKR